MGENVYLIIVVAVIVICFFSGKQAGLIRTLIPIVTAFISLWIFSVVFQIVRADVVSDVKSLSFLSVVIDLLAFVVSFFLLRWIIKAALKALRIIGDAPVIGSANRILGGLAGFVGGFILVWTVFFFMALFVGEAGAPDFYRAVNSNKLLGFIYNHNLVMTFVNYFIFVK